RCGAEWRRGGGSFFFQAEDGIRDWSVTGVQTCALPIWPGAGLPARGRRRAAPHRRVPGPELRPRCGPVVGDGARVSGRARRAQEIGRASCRERGEIWGGGGWLREKRREAERGTRETRDW